MQEKTRQHSSVGQTFNISDTELRTTLEEYLKEEQKNGANFWNFSTITGLAMVFIAMTAASQWFLESTFGFSPGLDLSGLLSVLPVIGGVLLVLVGMGYIASEKKEKKKKVEKMTSRQRTADHDPLDDFLYPQGGQKSRKKSKEKAGRKAGSRPSSGTASQGASQGVDSFALSQKKKLFKSRSDKNIAGVCGGLAQYFGISSTTVRLIFAIGTVLGYGSFILIYIALAIALPKEPIDLMHDFEIKS